MISGGQVKQVFKLFSALAMSSLFALSAVMPGLAAESTMPPSYVENISPEAAAKYVYTEGGPFADACGLPTYQWLPSSGNVKAVIVGIHGLTLHGRRYRVMARTLAVNNIGFVAMDMWGFGANKFNPDGSIKKNGEKVEVDHEKSYQDIVKLVQSVRAAYPNVPLVLMGESLGCTFCIRLAGEYPQNVSAVVLSAPAVRVNPKMYASPSDIKAGIKAIVSPHHEVNLHGFFTDLVSTRKEVADEMIDDPFITKSLKIRELLSTDIFVDKTVEWAKGTSEKLPLFVLQGSNDSCVLPKHLTDLMMHMKSDDMRIAWKGTYGHLQFETMFMRAPVIDSIAMWLHDHTKESWDKLQRLEQTIAELGGTIVR